MAKWNVNYDEALELAANILNADEDNDDIESLFFEKFNCDLSSFHLILDKIFPMIDVNRSPLTGEWFKGFSEGNMWIVKAKHPNGESFLIGNMIEYVKSNVGEADTLFITLNDKCVMECKLNKEALQEARR